MTTQTDTSTTTKPNRNSVPAPEMAGAKDISLELGVQPTIIRRHLRKLGIKVGETGTYAWPYGGKEHKEVVKKVKASLAEPTDSK